MDDIVAKPLKADLLKRMLKDHDRRKVDMTQITSSQHHASSHQMVSDYRGPDLSPPFTMGEKNKDRIRESNQDGYKSV